MMYCLCIYLYMVQQWVKPCISSPDDAVYVCLYVCVRVCVMRLLIHTVFKYSICIHMYAYIMHGGGYD